MSEAQTTIAVTVLCFASIRENLGVDSVRWEGPTGTRVGDLRAILATRYPALRALLSGCRMAMNQEFVTDDQPLQAGAEVAIIPPISGG